MILLFPATTCTGAVDTPHPNVTFGVSMTNVWPVELGASVTPGRGDREVSLDPHNTGFTSVPRRHIFDLMGNLAHNPNPLTVVVSWQQMVARESSSYRVVQSVS